MNPLVTAVMIGDYTNSTLPSIVTANKDYENIVDAFNIACGYTVVVATQDATNKDDGDGYKLRQFDDDNTDKSCNFKIKWTSDEIEDFNEKLKTDFIDNENTQFDSLIYIVSSHGDGKNLVYDGNGEDFSLSFIYHQFNNANCRNLINQKYICMIYLKIVVLLVIAQAIVMLQKKQN